ncbi:hypothetical protein BDV19DRAFT_357919 [Aspergillus venezuelensis]
MCFSTVSYRSEIQAKLHWSRHRNLLGGSSLAKSPETLTKPALQPPHIYSRQQKRCSYYKEETIVLVLFDIWTLTFGVALQLSKCRSS